MEDLKRNRKWGIILLILFSCNLKSLKTSDKFRLSKISSIRVEDLVIDSSENKLIGKGTFNWKTKNKYIRFWIQVDPEYFVCKKHHKHYINKQSGYRGPTEYLNAISLALDSSFLTHSNDEKLPSIKNFENSNQRLTSFQFVKNQWRQSFLDETGEIPHGTICFVAYKDSIRKYSKLSPAVSLKTSKKILVYRIKNWEY